MNNQLFETIQSYNRHLALLECQLKEIGFLIPADFLYYDIPTSANEWDLIQYLTEKFTKQQNCEMQLRTRGIHGLDFDELFQDYRPPHILEEVYGPKYIYEWMQAVHESNISLNEFYEHLRFGLEQDTSIFLYV